VTAERKPLIEINGLRTQFLLQEGTVTALDGIDLTIYENESVGIVGETGCGKSMTAFSILRLVPPPGSITGGNVFFKEPKEVRNRRLRYAAEAQAWYERQTLEKRREIFAAYGPGSIEREGAGANRVFYILAVLRRIADKMHRLGPMRRALRVMGEVAHRLGVDRWRVFTGSEIQKMVPPDEAPHRFVVNYLSLKAKEIPESDKVGKDAAQYAFDLLNKSHDYMRGIRGRQISMIFQDPSTSLDPVFTIGSQLGEVISLHQNIYDEAPLKKKIIDVLKLVRIAAPESVMKQYPHELSGGMKQRVMIALALSCNPSLLIADEPTTALDVTIQAQVLKLLKDLVKRVGSSMMLITHNLGIVAETCDRVCIMYAGRIVEDAGTLELFGKPMHPYARGLLTAFPKLGEQKEELSVIRGTVPNLMNPFPGCSFVDRCDFAMDQCGRTRPKMAEVSPGHFVACHLYSSGGVKGNA
jgi:peptide/nickel transport system ATP-binding protein